MEAKAVIGKEVAVTGLARIEGRVVISVVWTMFIPHSLTPPHPHPHPLPRVQT